MQHAADFFGISREDRGVFLTQYRDAAAEFQLGL